VPDAEPIRVLILEDDPLDAELALATLADGGLACEAEVVSDRTAFEQSFGSGRFALVLADNSLPGFSGLEALRYVRDRDAQLPFILVSGTLGEERAVESIKAGATDFVIKTRLERLPTAARRALAEHGERRALAQARRQIESNEQRLRWLSRRLLSAQEDERRRLSRELHDDIGQSLTAIKISLTSLARHTRGAAIRARVAEIEQIATEALDRTRHLSVSLRPPQLEDFGLADALRLNLARQAAVGGIAIEIAAEALPERLDPQIGITCFRVAQEALTNILRHARASRVQVSLKVERGELVLEIGDDGAGFEVAAAHRAAARGQSMGLASMEERVALVNGTLEIRSTPGSGTDIAARIPLSTGSG